jgi:hypothetical protein
MEQFQNNTDHTDGTVPKQNRPFLFWNCSISMVCVVLELFHQYGMFCFGTVPSVWSVLFWNCSISLVCFVLELFHQYGLFCFGTVPSVWSVLFWNCSISMVCFVLELFHQYGLFCFGTVPSVWYVLFWNRSISMVCFVSKTKQTILMEQFQNKTYHTDGTVPKQNRPY